METLQNTAFVSHVKTQFLPSSTATVATFATVKNLRKPEIQKELLEKTRVLSINKLTKVYIKKAIQKLSMISFTSLLASCQPSYAIASTNQNLNNHSFNYVELVAVTSNNVKQERQNLFTTVLQHHTIVDVFLCLSFANSLFTGELRLALALVRLWWGGHGNKPLGANTVCRCCNGSEPPCRPTFRANNQNIITRQKGTTK